MAVSVVQPQGINVTIPTGPPGPQGPPGLGVAVKGTYAGTGRPLPANPVTGDMWIVGTPIPVLTPSRPDGTPAEPGDGMVWSGTTWVNSGPIQGPEGPDGPIGPQGVMGPPGIIMSPEPPTVTTALWADTDEVGFDGNNGVTGVFAHNTPPSGLSLNPGSTVSVTFTVPSYGTATPLPPGWSYHNTQVVVPPGIYSFHLGWNAPDEHWYGRIQGAYQLGTPLTYVDIVSGAPMLDEEDEIWYGSASGTAVLHNTQALPQAPWFSLTMTHSSQAPGGTSVVWAFNVTRLGNIPA